MQPVLTIDLSTGAVGEFVIPVEWERHFLGGASLAARMLYDHLTPELDPLSPEAPLLFLNGPLSGTSGPVTGRFVVCALSPATGLWGESNCGGFWAPELRKAGYDGVWITGRSDQPVYIWIHDGEVALRSAKDHWGLDTYTTQEKIAAELNAGKPSIACIGPAGEAQIPMALILCDHGRVAGRTGMGAVMGAKNLKAVAVKGTQPIPLHDPQTYTAIRSAANRALRQDTLSQSVREMGSAAASDYFDYLGSMPKRGFTRGLMEGVEVISGATIAETILVGITACHACVIACGRVVALEDGKKRKGPEYETLVGFGPILWLLDAAVATRMGELCDRYGMDAISASNTISFAITLFELGIITLADTGGLALAWGDAAVVEELVHLMGKNQGFGSQLAQGARALGRRYGSEERAVQVNGLEVANHDPRGLSGMALVYATSPRGACHNQSDYFMVEIGSADDALGMQYFSRQEGAAKAANVAIHQDWRTIFNALVVCFFGNVPPQTIVDLINPACGLDWTIQDMLLAGERAWNLKRAINNRLGLTRANDKLPQPLLEPLPDGGAAGFVVDFDAMLDAYYTARSWDPQSGYPTRDKLISLDLGWVADDLWPQT
ncbi:MAG: aldehyde ferredoxin oxidoreductase family protein [Anaerolineae bacterium]|nr:aldehyde ferredoxin oxidoreductase family protein [Anaerolineae bacterium]